MPRVAHGDSEFGIIRAVPTTKGVVRHLALSTAERWALGFAATLLLLHASGAGDALEYRRALLASEPWRLITGHFVHINWPHVLINAAALVIVARLFAPDLSAPRQALVLVSATLLIGLGLGSFAPQVHWYRGLSGALHALFFSGATLWLVQARPRTLGALWLPVALVVGGWIKVALEQPTGGALPYADWLGAAVVPQAHLIGAAWGSAVGLALTLTSARQHEQRGEQQPR
jgi:rhomboid family GlyGly-CTERM serine protease